MGTRRYSTEDEGAVPRACERCSRRKLGRVPHFLVKTVHGPNWDETRGIREQEGWEAHAEFMDTLVADGFVVLGGPLSGGERTLHVVEAADEAAVRARVAADPWAVAGLLRIGSLEPWALWLDSRAGSRPAVPDGAVPG